MGFICFKSRRKNHPFLDSSHKFKDRVDFVFKVFVVDDGDLLNDEHPTSSLVLCSIINFVLECMNSIRTKSSMFTHGRKCSSFEGFSNRSCSKTRRESVESGGGEGEKRGGGGGGGAGGGDKIY